MVKKTIWVLADPFSDWLPAGLSELGLHILDLSHASPEVVKKESIAAEGLILSSKITLDEFFFNQATNLKYVIRGGSGLENIDLKAAQERNIQVVSLPQGNRDAVAEQAVGMLLMLLNNLQRSDNEVRKFIWKREENRGTELYRKTVGIIGYGNTGSALATRLSGFGCDVIAYDKYKNGIDTPFVRQVSLTELQQHCDILSFHVPLTPETYHFGNDDFWKKFTKKIWVLNLSRGAVIETKSLLHQLISGKILGAALDVLEDEPLSRTNESQRATYEQLFRENVVLSPHIGGWTFESRERISKLITAEVQRIYKQT